MLPGTGQTVCCGAGWVVVGGGGDGGKPILVLSLGFDQAEQKCISSDRHCMCVPDFIQSKHFPLSYSIYCS